MARRLSSPVFVARDEQLAALDEAASVAAAARPSLVLIGGEAGVGKTRLVGEALGRLREAGWLCIRGEAVALGTEGLPFGPIVDAIRGIAADVGTDRVGRAVGPMAADLGRLVPELLIGTPEAEIVPAGQPAWLQTRVFQAVRALLADLGKDRPVALAIEDLHWADRSTRDLLAYLIRTARDERLLIAATFRTDELHRRHPLLSWLAEVERLPGVDRIDVPRMRREELTELLTAILGTAPSARLLRSIEERSEGNAFFAEELLAASTEDAAALPDTLREVLLVRLGLVSDEAAKLAEVAAVAGPEVEHDVLAAVSGTPAPELADRLRELFDAQLLLPDRGGATERYRFRHALVPEALYGELPPAERRRTHAAYGRALAARTAGGAADASALVALAHHWQAAREPGLALQACLDAADAVRTQFAFAEAARLYEQAIELWDLVPADDRPAGRDLGDLLEAAAETASWAGESARALRHSREAIEFVDGAESPLRRRAQARGRLGSVAQQAGETRTSIGVLEEAVTLLDADGPSALRARLVERLATHLMLSGRSAESLPLAERAIAEARAVGEGTLDARTASAEHPSLIEANALATLAVARASVGDLEGGLAAADEACALAERLGDPWLALRAYGNLGAVRELAGRLEEALAANQIGLEILRSLGAGRSLFAAGLEVNAATLLIQLGRLEEADSLLRPLVEVPLPGFAMVNAHGAIADVAMRLGDLERARDHLGEARATFANVDDAQYTISRYTIGTEIELWSGEAETALSTAIQGLERVREKDDALLIGPLIASAMGAAAEVAITARARRDIAGERDAIAAADEALERFRRSTDRLASPGPIARGEIEWRVALCEAERSRGHGTDSSATWAGVREREPVRARPFLEAYVRWREAEALARAEGPAASAPLLRAAHERASSIGARLLADEIGRLARRMRIELGREDQEPLIAAETGADAAALVAPSDPYGLTPREREILALVATGLTNRQVADHLFIAESTAGVHVSNILGKLGVRSRTEAAAVAVRLGLDAPQT